MTCFSGLLISQKERIRHSLTEAGVVTDPRALHSHYLMFPFSVGSYRRLVSPFGGLHFSILPPPPRPKYHQFTSNVEHFDKN